MPVQAPKIDRRTYGDIVAQIEELATRLTSNLQLTPEALRGYTLDQDIIDPAGRVIATKGTVVDARLAEQISQIQGLGKVKVKGWQLPGAVIEVEPTPEALRGYILNQDITMFVNGRVVVIATKGTVVDARLAEQISQIQGLGKVEVMTGQDAGWALIRISAHLAKLVVDRLNQVPQKNFLAFLDLIGTQIRPPQPARVPLTFRLATGSPVDAVVPVRTRAAAPLQAGEENEVIFETERDLVVTRAQLTSVLVREPDVDRYGDYTAPATGVVDASFPAFAGDQPIEHSLYLAWNGFFTLPGPKSATLTIDSPDAQRLVALPIVWSYWDGASWQELSIQSSLPSPNRWQVTITDLPAPTPRTINGLNAGWLQARLDVQLPGIEAGQTETQRKGLTASAAAADDTLLDLQAPFYPFGETTPLADFFLNVQEAFECTGASVTLSLSLREIGNASHDLVLLWQFWNGSAWQELGRSGHAGPSLGVNTFNFADTTQGFTRDGSVTFSAPSQWRSSRVADRRGRWLRVQIVSGNYGVGAVLRPPQIRSLTADYAWLLPSYVIDPPRIDRIMAGLSIAEGDLVPDWAFANVLSIDLSKDFYPFGEKPRFNDALYVASQVVFAKPGAEVIVTVLLRNPNPEQKPPPEEPSSPPVPVLASRDLVVAWEVYDGRTWQELGRSSRDNPSLQDGGFKDETQAFTRDGRVRFTLPPEISQGTVNGVASYWIRARILQGNYGREAYYRLLLDEEGNPRLDQNDNPMYVLVPASFAPPVVASMTLSYTYQPSGSLSACQTYNDFTYVNHTVAAEMSGSPFQPFTPTTDTRPTLYLGFDQPFDNRPMALYARVEPPLYDEAAVTDAASEAAGPAQLIWEYAGSAPDGWSRLGVQDETRAFAERGLIMFIGPQDFTARREFAQDQALYWLRVRWEQGTFDVAPRLRRLLTNTTWASQAATIQNEVLGSSDGSPNQTFRTARAPVLRAQRIEVREREMPSPSEQVDIEALEGRDAITPVSGVAGRLQEVWVRWHEVPDFYGSGPQDRHYVLDHLMGEVRFGDGRHGMVPPQNRNNIRAALYRTGGGTRGNRPAGTIVQLKSAVPYVDGVTNYEAAGGGAEQEDLEAVKQRGPRLLRHRDRAVTPQDFEDLAHEASSDVAVARAIAARHGSDAGRVGLILVPRSTDPQPIPSLELINYVEDYILARCAPTVAPWIVGPDWVRVTVTAQVVPVSFEAISALQVDVITALQRFLHPLTGGLDGRGWPFGRKPHTSDLYALIESLGGVDYVRSLSVTEEEVGTVRPDQFLIFSGTHVISLVSSGEEA